MASVSALSAFAVAAALIAGFVVMKRRRNGAVHSTMSPKSIRQADSTQLDADGQVLRSSMRAITSGEVYSPASSSGSSKSKNSRNQKEADSTDGIESGGSADEDV